MKITWTNFSSIHGDGAQSQFEVLSGLVVERIENGRITNTPENYKGIESEPFKNPSGEDITYQAKYFTSATESVKRTELNKSLKKLSKAEIQKIDVLYICANTLYKSSQDKIKKSFASHCKKEKVNTPKIKFLCGINAFESHLLIDKDFENARAFFFGGGNPRQLHDLNLPLAVKQAFIGQEYIDLTINTLSKSFESSNILDEILKISENNILISSKAGTGKSFLLQKIAYEMTCLNQDYSERMASVLKEGIVIFIRANLCKGKTLNTLIYERLNECSLTITDYPISLILDGIDELSLVESTKVINELQDLFLRKRIKRCISSVREVSGSALRYQQTMKPYVMDIAPLTEAKVLEYFLKKNDASKTKVMKKLMKDKSDISSLTDIRILELFWENIDKGIAPEKAEILRAAFEANLKESAENLNLLNPKIFALKTLLETLSVDILLKGGRSIPLSVMQNKILDNWDRLTYQDVNDIVEVISNICGDGGDPDGSGGTDFIFDHKSWIDYFSALKLAKQFTKDKKTILGVIDYEDVLKDWFVPVARSEYKKNEFTPRVNSSGHCRHISRHRK